MSFFARLLGRQGENGCAVKALPGSSTNKRAQPCSPPSGSFASDFTSGRPLAAPTPVKLQNGCALPQQQQHSTGQQQRPSVDSDEDDCTIRVPGSLSCSGDRNRSNSLARRRAAIDISPRAVQQLSDKVAALDAGHLDTGSGGVTRCEVEALYSDMQLIHRGRSSMVYRAREVRSGRRVILKAYDSRTLSSSSRRQALERQVLTLRAAQAATAAGAGSNGLVALERVVENADGTYLVVQACNGGTLIEAIANAGGKLPERQVAMKVALPLLNALQQLHTTGIVHRDIKPEHLMIHNGALKVGDFGSAGCASLAAAALASNLQKQALQAMQKQQQAAAAAAAADGGGAAADQMGQQALQLELEQLQHQQLHLQADCTAEASVATCADSACAEQQQQQQQQQQQSSQPLPRPLEPQDERAVQRFAVAADAVVGAPSPGVSGRLSVQAAKDGMNFRIGSIEYMAPEMLNKPTAAEVFHLVIAQGIDEDDLPTYDEKVDVWSAGVVLYEALSGLQPFLADSAEDMLTVIGKKMAARLEPAEAARQAAAQKHYHMHYHHQQHRSSSAWVPQQAADLPAFIARLQLSPDAKDFLASCLTWDPSRRPSTAQLLSHPWLQRMQDEAAAVAASRANSRRMSMQISMQRAALSSDDSAADTGSGAGAVEQQQQQQHVSLVDPVMAGMLEDSSAAGDHMHHHHESYERHNSLDLMASALERSQTSEQLEVGARNVLRSRTQRLDTRPMHARVHAA